MEEVDAVKDDGALGGIGGEVAFEIAGEVGEVAVGREVVADVIAVVEAAAVVRVLMQVMELT